MPKIIPLRNLKNASEISRLCHEESAPIFVTKNGSSDLVIMSSEVYDTFVEKQTALNKASLKNSKGSNFYLYNHSEMPLGTYVAEEASLESYINFRDQKALYSIAELKKVLSPIFREHGVKKATLFGSYVKGLATQRSDIDLVVETNLKGLGFYSLLADVSAALRFPVDLIEKRQIEIGSEIEKEIDETGVTIFG